MFPLFFSLHIYPRIFTVSLQKIDLKTNFGGNMPKIGKHSFRLENKPEIISSACFVGSREGNGPMGKYFDAVCEDDTLGLKSWEQAESRMFESSVRLALAKINRTPEDLSCVLGGDLLNQIISSGFAARELKTPFLGLYGACSAISESLIIGGMLVDGGYTGLTACAASSHFSSVERQFRFPLEMGTQPVPTSQRTVTGAGCVILNSAQKTENTEKTENSGEAGNNEETGKTGEREETESSEKSDGTRNSGETGNREKTENTVKTGNSRETGSPENKVFSHIVLTGGTIGKVSDYGITDGNNMGAAMAPAAAQTICDHFDDFSVSPSDYDCIVTGDLGILGSDMLYELCRERGHEIKQRHTDCGKLMFEGEKDVNCGASGCGCAATLLSGFFLPEIEKGKYNKILFVATGALLSSVSSLQGESIPGIAHGIVIERV